MGPNDEPAYRDVDVDPEEYITQALKAGTLVGTGHTTKDLWMLFLLGVVCPALILAWGWM
ncbi:hypothetical protein [Rhodospirillaceae bacterium SYSU D60014]|uniref:hypothetical protein n=1 Tax=Virgifigura deserti TaxID=2268457 RepID=UPI000E6653E7